MKFVKASLVIALMALVLLAGAMGALAKGPDTAAPRCCPWAYVIYPADDPVLLDVLYQFNRDGRPYELSVDDGQAYLYYQVHGDE
jgi:hypothetical protein